MTTRTVKKELRYILVYGSEALLPLEPIVLTNRTTNMDMERNDEDLRANLDVTMERREVAATRHEHYKKQTESYYNQWVKGKCFKIG